jgi:hypothetical protein
MSKRARRNLASKEKFVLLQHWMLASRAWRALPPLAKAIYIENFELSYTGCNNGDLALSERQIAKSHQCTQRTAAKMLRLLCQHGFIRPNVKGRFHVKTRCATTWVLTRHDHLGAKPTMDFMRRQPPQKESFRDSDKFKQRMPSGQQTEALRAADGQKEALSVVPRAADSTHLEASTAALRASHLVYHGEARFPPKRPWRAPMPIAEWVIL